jgi:hypothetical protein
LKRPQQQHEQYDSSPPVMPVHGELTMSDPELLLLLERHMVEKLEAIDRRACREPSLLLLLLILLLLLTNGDVAVATAYISGSIEIGATL